MPSSIAWAQIRARLEVLHSNLIEEQLIERLERACAESEEEEDECERRRALSKSNMLSKLYAEWRKKRSSLPCVTLASCEPATEGMLLSEPALVATEIARQWGVFSSAAC
eukprot:543539-Amphidinium_carterae.2